MSDQARAQNVRTTSIAPMLSVRNGARAIEFYKAAFGAEESFRLDDDTGAVVARLSVGEAEFWLADESPEHGNFSPESLGGGSVRMVMVVQDPDAAFERAVRAGATIVWPVGDQYGWRLGRIVDPFGHHWESAGLYRPPDSYLGGRNRNSRLRRRAAFLCEESMQAGAILFGVDQLVENG